MQSCVECYKSYWKVIRYNHRSLSSSVSSRSNLSKTLSVTLKQEFEVDFQGLPSESSSELGKLKELLIKKLFTLHIIILDLTSQSSSRQSVVSLASVSSCGDTLTPRNSWASLDLRHSAGDPLISEILEQNAPEVLDQLNETRRQIDRQDTLFAFSPSADVHYEVNEPPVEKRLPATTPSEHLGHRVLVKCQQLT